jgi:general secretion pathway protein K
VRVALKNFSVGRAGRRYQGGVALAILVWFLAAMSLLVAGIVMQARVDIKLAQLHATRARVEAAADGAMQLALAQMLQTEQAGKPLPPVLPSQVLNVGGFDVTVNITPVSGLIDINAAPKELLFRLFSSVDGVDEAVAQELAENVVDWRSPNPLGEDAKQRPAQRSAAGKSTRTVSRKAQPAAQEDVRHARFEAIEDLLLVAGIDRRIYSAVADAVCVSQAQQPGVDWAAAPVPVLRVLGNMDTESAQELAAARASGAVDSLVAPQDLDLSFQVAGQSTSYRLDAMVEVDGSVFDRRRWVDRKKPGIDGLPWTFFRTEALRVVASSVASSVALSEREGITMGEGVRAGS